jgi:hypothetical protein
MLEILLSCWNLVAGLAASVGDVISLVAVWGWDVLYHLHVSAPRLEGLLIGITLAWLMMRRDKHPLLRVLSAPLKLVVDILDLAWDQVVEVTSDLWETATGWVSRSYSWVRGKVVGVYSGMMSTLKSAKDKLSRKKE